MVELAVKAGLAFVAGGVSFCAPCVLPLIPVYLSFLTGTNLQSGESPGRAAALRQALCFVAGFSLIFIVVLGGAATALGRALYDALPLLRQVGGVLLIVLGLHLIGWLKLPVLYRERRFGLSPGQRASPATAFLTGIVFAAGWTPCVGPVLAGILALAADERSMARGLLLMACYAAGLGVPFILSALAVERATAWSRRLGPRLQTISTVSGVFVAALGVLLLFDVVGLLSRYLPAWEPPL